MNVSPERWGEEIFALEIQGSDCRRTLGVMLWAAATAVANRTVAAAKSSLAMGIAYDEISTPDRARNDSSTAHHEAGLPLRSGAIVMEPAGWDGLLRFAPAVA